MGVRGFPEEPVSSDIVIVGAGSVGANIAYRLAQRGAKVTLLDAGAPGGGTSSSSFAWVNAFRKTPRVYYDLNFASMAEHLALAEELSALTSQVAFDAHASARHLKDLETGGAPERTVATAKLQHDNLIRLQQLRAADAQALEELAELLEALRTQLLLARYSGSSADGAGAIVGEVWARLEGLGVAFEVGTGEGQG